MRQPLLHPVSIFALVVLVANDHFFKQQFGNSITGKLSDAAGLVLFPLFVLAVADFVTWTTRRTTVALARILPVIVLLTAAGFSSIQLLDTATHAYDALSTWLWRPARSTQDPTDLFALPALMVAALVAIHVDRRHDSPMTERLRPPQGVGRTRVVHG